MKAFIFDLNGTMTNNIDFHTRAWLHVLNDKLGGCYTGEQLRKELYGKSSEVLKRLFGHCYFSAFELDHLTNAKEEHYRKAYLPSLRLLPGLEQFLRTAKDYGIPMAIASSSPMENIDFVIDHLDIRDYFEAIVSAEQVRESTPHPETFERAAALLGIPPQDCLVFEDSPKGVEAASIAGMQAIVMTTSHQSPEFRGYSNIKAFWKNYYLSNEDIFKK